MRINNNFNVLPFYDSLQKQNSKKWYSFGQHYPLICTNNTILPFQFITDSEVTVSSNIEAVNVHSGKVTNLGVKPSVSKGTQADATYYIVKMVETTISAMPEGLHYLRINTNKGYLYSEEFTFNANHEECIKIEYWNENTLNFNSGEINFDDDFRFILYIPSTIGKPEYEFEEELTKRLGYKFIESQTSNKIYKFNFLAPEYICDAMRLIRLCDYIKLTTKFDTFNALSFAYEPKWQDNGDLAAVDVEFDTDCIIQKLESFNRRLKESFYNALLADIDEPVLFSNDIVAQYYTEFTTTSYINGKLIRQLEAINEAELGSLENLVLPIDNQSDTEQKAKKITLASLKNVLIKLADYVTLSTAQNINGEKNFIGGLKVNGSPIIYDSVNKCWKLQGNLVLTGGITMYADDGTLNLPSIYDGLPIDGTTIYWDTDAAGNRVLKAVGGGGTADSVAWNNITGKPSWIGSSKPTYSYSEIQNTPDLSRYALQTALDTTNTEVAKKWTKDNSKIANWDSAFGWGNHANAGYAKKTYVDETFVNLTGEQTISGKKNFTTGGLFVNGSQIKYDATKKYWKLEGDLLVTGGVTMYGSDSSFTPSTIMDAIAVDGTTISKSGGVLKVIGGTGGGVADSVAWANITGKPTFASVATSGKYSDLSGTPSSLPASDVYSWAKAANKPSYTWSEITSKPTWIGTSKPSYSYSEITGAISTTELQNYLTSNSYINVAGGDNRYLQLSGGTLSSNSRSPLTLKSGSSENHSLLLFNRGNDYWGSIGFNAANSLIFKDTNGANYTIWHSGNDGSGSSLDADLLDGKHLSDILSSNVASATKLQTARTIWGQSFDGTGNVSGALSGVTGITFKNDYYGLVIDEFGNFSFKKPYSTAAADWSFKDSLGNKLMIINNSGNVGIGTANPLYKLHIYSAANQPLFIEQKFSSNWADCIIAHNSSLSSGQHYSLCIGHSDTTKNRGVLAYYHNGEGSDNNRLCFGLHGVDDVVNVLGNGRVGIGTTSPTSKLEVSGIVKANYYDVNTTRQASLANSYTLGCGMYGSSVQHSVSDGYTLPALMWSAKSPNGNSSQFSIMSYHPSGATGYLIIGVAKNGTRTAFIEVQGDGVIQAGGDFLAIGGITMYSDQRKKTILNHVELSLKQIAEAPLIEHYYNSDDKKTTHVGSIAQYWASMNDWFCKLDNEGYYTMEIQNCALASAISIARELVKFENETDKRIRLLEEKNKELRNEIERLKAS